jgi:hypothetical protein
LQKYNPTKSVISKISQLFYGLKKLRLVGEYQVFVIYEGRAIGLSYLTSIILLIINHQEATMVSRAWPLV